MSRSYNVQLCSADGRRYVDIGHSTDTLTKAINMAKKESKGRFDTVRVIRKSDGKVFDKMINGRSQMNNNTRKTAMSR